MLDDVSTIFEVCVGPLDPDGLSGRHMLCQLF